MTKVINIMCISVKKFYYELLGYGYIYIYIFKEKKKSGYFRIINLFPSCFSVSGGNQKHEEKYNRTSSDPMDK